MSGKQWRLRRRRVRMSKRKRAEERGRYGGTWDRLTHPAGQCSFGYSEQEAKEAENGYAPQGLCTNHIR